jgi:ABC-type transport system involved in multi-copper enzyme maturation permease subunit
MSKHSPPSLRDVLEIARFQVLEAARTRRVVVLALLFIVGGILSAWGFGHFLEKAAKMAADVPGAPPSDQTGAMLKWLQGTPVYSSIIEGAFGDAADGSVLATLPPMALIFAWLTMTFAPVLVLFTTSDAIGADIENRALRYTLLRTGRIEYVVGKFLGHLGLLTAVIALEAIAFLAVTTAVVSQVPVLETGVAMLRFWPWIVVDAMPYVALAIGASMLASSANGGRAMAIAALLGFVVLHALCGVAGVRASGVGAMFFEAIDYVTPFTRKFGVLAPVGGTFARSAGICFGLTIAYVGGAFAFFRSRDV